MTDALHVVVVLLTLVLSQRTPDTGTHTQLAGTWSGAARYGNESAPLIIALEPAKDGLLRGFFSNPIIHLWRVPLGAAKVSNGLVAVGPIDLDYDERQDTLTTTLPEAFVPVHEMTVIFRRSSPMTATPRPEIAAPVREPAWTHDVGSPIWADTLVSSGLVLVGSDDGALHALDANTGNERWAFRAAGAIRARPTRVADDVVFQADDGMLYRVGLADGAERWRVRVADRPTARLSLGDPKTRYENTAAAVATSNDRLFLGTHEGHVLALDARDGARVWDVKMDDSVVASPLVSGDRIVVGSFDGRVYALDAATGARTWAFDTHAPVTTAAAAFDGTVIVGSRSYDLFALDAKQGRPIWSRYFWFSWVECPATVYKEVAYIGSSDAAALHAFDARSGRTIWRLDVGGSAWAQPVVTDTTVYEGTVGVTNYLLDHRAAMIAVDNGRANPSGDIRWRRQRAKVPGDGRVRFCGISRARRWTDCRRRDRRPGLCVSPMTFYSQRRASTGSTRDARRAGQDTWRGASPLRTDDATIKNGMRSSAGGWVLPNAAASSRRAQGSPPDRPRAQWPQAPCPAGAPSARHPSGRRRWPCGCRSPSCAGWRRTPPARTARRLPVPSPMMPIAATCLIDDVEGPTTAHADRAPPSSGCWRSAGWRRGVAPPP